MSQTHPQRKLEGSTTTSRVVVVIVAAVILVVAVMVVAVVITVVITVVVLSAPQCWLGPIALTSSSVKIFEKIIKNSILSHVEEKTDPLQLAYQAGEGVEDAKLIILNCLYKHFKKPQAHARLTCADFSSAVNTMQPHLLLKRLISVFNLPHQVVLWLFDFLTNREQRVSVSGCLSDHIVLSLAHHTGVFSLLYYSTCTWMNAGAPRKAATWSNFLMTLLFLLHGSESDHGDALVVDFVSWCDEIFWT